MDESPNEASFRASPDGIIDPALREQPTADSAPRYPIPTDRLAAVEIPAIVENVDRAIKAFGRAPSLDHLLDPERKSIPLYLNPESPFCKPLMSHNAQSHNIVLKVTVPKRTGRKRKRGSNGPWLGDLSQSVGAQDEQHEGVCSRSRMDDPRILRKKLEDNVGRYQVEAVGVIKQTHRFRGLADFYWDMSKSDFANRYTEQALSGDAQRLKQFKFNPGVDTGSGVDIIPPPVFTHMRLPFNYQYSQNPYVRTTDDGDTFNATAVRHVGYFIAAEDPTPMGPQSPPDMTDVRTVEVIADLEAAFAERPLWTRRSLLNHLRGKLRNWNELKRCLNYTAYQFKGGPWRDSVVHYGVDPRSDPKYRQYQTLMFKLRPRNTKRSDAVFSLREATEDHANPDDPNSHLFDGQTYHTDGKVWQVCDITDPLLKDLLDNAPVRPTRDANTGWYHGGLWAKVKAIMKTKLVAIQFGRHLTRMDFAATLQVGDMTPARTGNAGAMGPLPLPNLRLTTEELTILRGREPKRGRHKSFSVRTREQRRPPASTADDQSQAPGAEAEDAEDDLLASDEIDSENEAESGSGSDDESLGEEDLGTDSWMQQ